jgi:hypothetical protein
MSKRVPDAWMDKLINEAWQQGFRTKETANRHVMFFPPNSGPPILFHRHAKTWKLQMEKLKAAGFNQIEVAVKEAITPKPPPEPVVDLPKLEPPKRGEMKAAIIEFMQHAGRPMHVDDVYRHIKAKFKVSRDSVNAGLSYVAAMDKTIKNVGKGMWNWVGVPEPKPEPPVELVIKPIGETRSEVVPAGISLGDSTMDAEIKELDEALAALARISGVVERLRKRLAKLADLKKALGDM